MKLTARQKANIVSAYAAGGISYSTLAAKYGVSIDTIYRIVSRSPDLRKKAAAIKTMRRSLAFVPGV